MGVGLVALLSIVTFVAVNALVTYVVVPSMDAGYRGEARFGGVKIESVVTSALSSADIPGVTGSLLRGTGLTHRESYRDSSCSPCWCRSSAWPR